MMEDKPMNVCELQELLRDKLTVERYEILELLRELLRTGKSLEDAIELVKQRIAAGKA